MGLGRHFIILDIISAYLQENLPKIEELANQVLQDVGCQDVATVRLAVEEFSTRVYDTFTLPAICSPEFPDKVTNLMSGFDTLNLKHAHRL